MMLEILARFGYTTANDAIFLQCFEAEELQRLRREHGCRLRLVQLIDSSSGNLSAAALARIGGYADAIGPAIGLIYQGMSGSTATLTSLVDDAHAKGLAVHPYTFRKDDLPPGITDFGSLLNLFIAQIGVDGIFTDFPDLATACIARHFPA